MLPFLGVYLHFCDHWQINSIVLESKDLRQLQVVPSDTIIPVCLKKTATP